jgi:hypothetical protein
MKKISFLFAFLFLTIIGTAQKSTDIGVFGGVGYYMGDVNIYKQFYSTNKAYGGVVRFNFNKRYSLKVSFIKSRLEGHDSDFANLYQQQRNHNFDISVTDFTSVVEFNFFDFSTQNPRYYISPYLSAGMGLAITPDIKTKGSLVIPFALGMKFRINSRFSTGFEWTFRKTFTDNLDNLDEQLFSVEGNNIFENKQKTVTLSNDWYSFAGVFLAFTLYERTQRCRAYYN